jgi:hypothetical protein
MQGRLSCFCCGGISSASGNMAEGLIPRLERAKEEAKGVRNLF